MPSHRIMQLAAVAAVAALAATVCSAHITNPVVPSQYTVNLTMELIVEPDNATYIWPVHVAYDALHNRSLTIHGKGQKDEICRGVSGYENSDEPCINLINDGFRFAFYPNTGYCCAFCPASGPQTCGIVSPNWAEHGKYVGTSVINGVSCDEFYVQGTYGNHFYVAKQPKPTTPPTVMPCRFWETKPHKIALKQLTYDYASWQVGAPAAHLFDLPSQSCYNTCTRV
eukprot:PLAT4758.1.p1 GENE.PLAT4758.1~~PLAT4758.1.p1  ORF type:complete len:253 (+),score=78.45 PLAT4758.1:84-761(+)